MTNSSMEMTRTSETPTVAEIDAAAPAARFGCLPVNKVKGYDVRRKYND